MIKKEKIIEELQVVSGILSEQGRYITFSILGIVLGVMIGNTDFTHDLGSKYNNYFITLLFLSTLTLAIDYLQYFAGYKTNIKLNNLMDNENLEETEYDKNEVWYRIRNFCFICKQYLLLVNVIIMLSLLVMIFCDSCGGHASIKID